MNSGKTRWYYSYRNIEVVRNFVKIIFSIYNLLHEMKQTSYISWPLYAKRQGFSSDQLLQTTQTNIMQIVWMIISSKKFLTFLYIAILWYLCNNDDLFILFQFNDMSWYHVETPVSKKWNNILRRNLSAPFECVFP